MEQLLKYLTDSDSDMDTESVDQDYLDALEELDDSDYFPMSDDTENTQDSDEDLTSEAGEALESPTGEDVPVRPWKKQLPDEFEYHYTSPADFIIKIKAPESKGKLDHDDPTDSE
jgi:hypothetical protein